MDQSSHYQVIIIGAGPGGLSAAGHAAKCGLNHLLLEASPAHANTIQKYQKGKHVMAEPNILPLRSPMKFEAGKREVILAQWETDLAKHHVNIRYQSEVTSIEGQHPNFTIQLADNSVLTAEHVVLGIGLQGNPRRLGCEGESLPFIQYQLDDPEAYQDETIIVVGAGDAAIENALALCEHNQVFIVNRRAEFARAKPGNLQLITSGIENDSLECLFETTVKSVETADDTPGAITFNTPQGERTIACHRIIARLGAIPPRKFVESCGIRFPSDDIASLPVLSEQYESSVKGLYVIGALAGYPLIKQAMNQGFEVIESIQGNEVVPADEPLLIDKLKHLPGFECVSTSLQQMQKSIPLFTQVNPLGFREFLLDSQVHVFNSDATIFRKNDYTNSFYSILSGEVNIIPDETQNLVFTLERGQFFGEMGLLSGRRRTATVKAKSKVVVIETPRRTMKKLIQSDASVQRVIDETFIIRAIQGAFGIPHSEILAQAVKSATIESYHAGEVLFEEGDDADSLHLIRSGSVMVTKQLEDREIVLSYVASGNYIGEMGLLGHGKRSATIKANVKTETVRLSNEAFARLLDAHQDLKATMQQTIAKRLQANTSRYQSDRSHGVLNFMMQQGLGEATDVLLIDESLCVGCDNCEKACADTHQGTSRLNREAGPTYAQVHIPTSCRHCEDPHCMTDCPPDAIKRAANGEVYITQSCIGCGNCEQNCPYDVIQMAYPQEANTGFWSWLFTGKGHAPGEHSSWNESEKRADDAVKKAVKCDMCQDQSGGPACVRACPTGAAIRVAPEQLMDWIDAQ